MYKDRARLNLKTIFQESISRNEDRLQRTKDEVCCEAIRIVLEGLYGAIEHLEKNTDSEASVSRHEHGGSQHPPANHI